MSRSERRAALELLLDSYNFGDAVEDVPASIPVMYGRLDLQPGSGAPGRRAPGFGSMPPLSIHILVMLDDRSQVGSPCTWFPMGPNGKPDYSRPHTEEPNPPRAIRKALSGLVGLLYEEVMESFFERAGGVEIFGPLPSDFLAPADQGVSALCQWLFERLDWIVDRADVEEIHTDLTELSDQLRRAIGDGPPDPVGNCIELIRDRHSHEQRYCGAPLYLPPPTPDDPTQTAAEIAREVVTTCSRCSRPYRRLDLVRVKVSQAA